MIPIFLLGEENDAAIRLPLCRVLERHGGVLHICGAHAAQYAIGPARFLLYETSRLDSIQAERALLIFKTRQAFLAIHLRFQTVSSLFWKPKTKPPHACFCTPALPR